MDDLQKELKEAMKMLDELEEEATILIERVRKFRKTLSEAKTEEEIEKILVEDDTFDIKFKHIIL